MNSKQSNSKLNRILKTLGPGILFASCCIGVSHLVQSTRAGADYGFAIVWAILLANIFKYPFFEFGSRYANATGESLLEGYARKGKWVLWMYFILTLGSMFAVTAAVGYVTTGLTANLFQLDLNISSVAAILFAICMLILLIGKFSYLDNIIKVFAIVLLTSTVIAFITTLFHGSVEQSPDFIPKSMWNPSGIAFLIALMGWMPTAVDLSTWNSLWTLARIKQSGYYPKLKETINEFNFAYIITAVLSLCFLTLGAMLMHGSGKSFSNNSVAFANELITLYTTSLGDWSYLIIASAAFATMFSTSLAVIDGYSRALDRTTQLLFLNHDLSKGEIQESRKWYTVWTFINVPISFFVITFFLNNLRALVDLATTLSFLIAPVIAIINYKVILGHNVPEEAKPPIWLRYLAIAGIIFLSGFSLFYVYSKFL